MNKELVDQLFDDAKELRVDEDGIECLVFNKYKFAELIVKECVDAVYDDGQDSEYYQNLIKQHFGVR